MERKTLGMILSSFLAANAACAHTTTETHFEDRKNYDGKKDTLVTTVKQERGFLGVTDYKLTAWDEDLDGSAEQIIQTISHPRFSRIYINASYRDGNVDEIWYESNPQHDILHVKRGTSGKWEARRYFCQADKLFVEIDEGYDGLSEVKRPVAEKEKESFFKYLCR